MKQTRKKHSPALKDKVALAALQGEQTIVESGTLFQTSVRDGVVGNRKGR